MELEIKFETFPQLQQKMLAKVIIRFDNENLVQSIQIRV